MSAPQAAVCGLEDLLNSSVQALLPAAQLWCESQGCTAVQDIIEADMTEDFLAALTGVTDLQQRLIRKRFTSISTQHAQASSQAAQHTEQDMAATGTHHAEMADGPSQAGHAQQDMRLAGRDHTGNEDTSAKRQKMDAASDFVFVENRENVFSNFYQVSYLDEGYGIRVQSSEVSFQARKASFLGFGEAGEAILKMSVPWQAKKRTNPANMKANPANMLAWDSRESEAAMLKTLYYKFSTGSPQLQLLLQTQERRIVEARQGGSRKWGAGIGREQIEQNIREAGPGLPWPGENRLGELLMMIRSARRQEEAYSRGAPPKLTSLFANWDYQLVGMAGVWVGPCCHAWAEAWLQEGHIHTARPHEPATAVPMPNHQDMHQQQHQHQHHQY